MGLCQASVLQGGLSAAGRSQACRTEGHRAGSVNCLCSEADEPRIAGA